MNLVIILFRDNLFVSLIGVRLFKYIIKWFCSFVGKLVWVGGMGINKYYVLVFDLLNIIDEMFMG